jgi:hypothetical protein
LCLIVASAIIIIDVKFHTYLYTFFGVDPLNNYDEVAYLTKSEELQLRKKKTSDDLPLMDINKPMDDDEDDTEYVPVYIKRKTRPFGPPIVRSNKPKHLMNM